jgi:ferredoxin
MIRYGGSAFKTRVSSSGTMLRSILLDNGLSPYNGGANVVNCRGLGTCGTCAVEVQVAEGGEKAHLGPITIMEKVRLALPPHDGKGLERGMRLACQCTVAPGAVITVEKHGGFWGQKDPERKMVMGSSCSSPRAFSTAAHHGHEATPHFDFEAIRRMKPWPHWLQQEMRSNHAGETGAVMIYSGAAFALGVRLWLRRIFEKEAGYSPYEEVRY